MGQSGRSTLRSGRNARIAKQDGEAGQNDVKRQIDSDLNNSKQIYQLVNVKTGGGKLIDIIKSQARHHSLNSLSSDSFANVRNDADDAGRAASTYKRPDAAARTMADHKLVHDYDQEADEQIRTLVEPLLYNSGRGRLVPLARIWRYRFGGAAADGDQEARLDADDSDDTGPALWSPSTDDKNGGPDKKSTRTADGSGGGGTSKRFRWVCWRLEERGFVGETALHICFLLSTPTHMILAKKLLVLFPMLINDIYHCDEYFGESSLHMAIVNEDVKIVKLLLDHGANVHERCLGSFFLPNDQKDKANGQIKRRLLQQQQRTGRADNRVPLDNDIGIDLQSNQFSDPHTDYEGYTYWGEYPLSFAASLGLADCYKLLLAKGASPNRLDSNGNSTLHICVIANRLDMFDLCYSNGARLDIHNQLGFSPLTLAAKLRRVEMFFHILTIMRQVNWIFCNVGFVDIPLDEIDSINVRDGSCNDHSVLAIVVSGVSCWAPRSLGGAAH
jgi:transient receptor potential cation channel subfamily V protein 5